MYVFSSILLSFRKEFLKLRYLLLNLKDNEDNSFKNSLPLEELKETYTVSNNFLLAFQIFSKKYKSLYKEIHSLFFRYFFLFSLDTPLKLVHAY